VEQCTCPGQTYTCKDANVVRESELCEYEFNAN